MFGCTIESKVLFVDSWPILPSHEKKVISSSVLTQFNSLCIRQVFGESCFLVRDRLTPVDSLLDKITLLSDIMYCLLQSNHGSEYLPSKILLDLSLRT